MKERIKNTFRRLPEVFKYLLVGGVVAFISFICPNHIPFKYQFENGKKWAYEDLQAPFDFAILKTEEELTTEKESVAQDFSPYYALDPEVVRVQKAKFNEGFDKQLLMAREDSIFHDVAQKSRVYQKFGLDFIDRTFSRGIIVLNREHGQKGKDFVINVLKGNVNEKRTIQSLITAEEVSKGVGDTLFNSGLPEAEFLIPVLEGIFKPNIFYNDTLTNKLQNGELAKISTSRGLVQRGDIIVEKSEVISPNIYQVLVSFREQYQQEVTVKRSFWGVFIGYLVLTGLLMGVYLLYLQFNEERVFSKFNQLTFLLLWFVVYGYMVYVVEGTDILSAYLIPFCIVPIVIKNFFNERLALFTHIINVLIASFLSSLGYEFTFIQILAGIVAVLTNIETRYWSRFFFSMLYIFITYALVYLGLSLIKEGTLTSIDPRIYLFLSLNVLLTLLAYPLIPLLEKLFGFISSITLAELSDLNRPLLKTLSVEAPGTCQHSIQVANLSEVAARKIGANALLVKTGALYHDIGKIKNPEYFIENQGGESPHKELDSLDSAKIIIGHVSEGVKIAKKYRLPNVLIDFIKTHHGTTKVAFFLHKYKEDNPDIEFDETLFQYPGPNPRTKEESILMMADSIEAASKSLKQPQAADIDALVDKIVAHKVNTGQFEESELTFEELEICKHQFKSLLRSIYHVRIEYPSDKTA